MLRYLFFIFIFSSCFNNHEQNTYDIFSPILLNHDSTKIYISDYIHNKRVDSVYCNLEYKYFKDKEEIVIFSHPNNPYLSILKLYVANQSYDILLRKSLKQKIRKRTQRIKRKYSEEVFLMFWPLDANICNF